MLHFRKIIGSAMLVATASTLGVLSTPFASIASAASPTHYGVSATIGVGAESRALAVHESSQTYFSANYAAGSVTVIRNNKPIATVAVGIAPTAVAVDQSDGTAYVSNSASNTVSVIRGDAVVKTISVGHEPKAIAVDSRDHTAYVIDYFDYGVSVIRDLAVVATLSVGTEPVNVAVDESTHTAYVTNSRSSSVTLIHDDTIAGTVSVGSGPNAVVVDSVSSTAFVANAASNTVSVIKAGSVRATVPVEEAPLSLGLNTNDHTVYVGNMISNSVSVIRGGVVATTVQVGARPAAVAVDSSAGVAYVANTGGKSVSVIAGDSVLATVNVSLGTYSPLLIANQATHGAYVGLADTSSIAEIGQVTFHVDRIGGADRYAVATAISESAFPGTAPAVFVASGANYPDALSAGPAAAQAGGPVLLTTPDQLPEKVASEIARLKPKTIWIIGGVSSVSENVEKQIGAVWASTIHRIGGADRYEVSRNIAKAFFSDASRAYVATGTNFPDALSAGSAAASSGSPVVLVNGTATEVDGPTTTLLRDTLAITGLTIAGGPNSVSRSVEGALGRIAATKRLDGADRYAASLSINLDTYKSATHVYLATGANFPDALAGSAVAGGSKSPLFVVPTDCVPSGVISALSTLNVSDVTLLGGPNSLSSRVESLDSCVF